MAGFNRKRLTQCVWCGESIVGKTDGTLVRIRRQGPGWSMMPAHRNECAEVYAFVMSDNGYEVKVSK